MRRYRVAHLLGLLTLLFVQIPVICSCTTNFTNGTYRRESCGLTEVPTDIPSDAKKVVLINNQISNIPATAFSHLDKCTELRLDNNTLTLIDGAYFVGLQSLKTLVLQNNYIANIKPYAFVHLEQCTHIWMKGNKLTQIKVNMFKGLQLLEVLAVNNNNIMDIAAGAFGDMNKCIELILSHNELKHIKREMLEGLENLQILSLQYNKITIIDTSTFDHIPQCTELYLGANDLINIKADTFEKLPLLLKLGLGHNRITEIEPATFIKQTKLKFLSLHRNRLRTLRRDVFNSQHQTNLTLLLSFNPLLCDSKLCWMKRAEQHGWITLTYTENATFLSKPSCSNYPYLDWDNIILSCNAEDYLYESVHENNENYIFYILGGVAGSLLLLFCIIIIIILCLRLRGGRNSEERPKDGHSYMNLLRRQALPDPPTNQQHPVPSQADVLPISGDVTTTPFSLLGQHVTPRPVRDSDGYEVPLRDSYGYGVPI